jgi:hypothetical protein
MAGYSFCKQFHLGDDVRNNLVHILFRQSQAFIPQLPFPAELVQPSIAVNGRADNRDQSLHNQPFVRLGQSGLGELVDGAPRGGEGRPAGVLQRGEDAVLRQKALGGERRDVDVFVGRFGEMSRREDGGDGAGGLGQGGAEEGVVSMREDGVAPLRDVELHVAVGDGPVEEHAAANCGPGHPVLPRRSQALHDVLFHDQRRHELRSILRRRATPTFSLSESQHWRLQSGR